MERHAELLSKLPEGTDTARLVKLVNAEVAALATHTETRMYRRVDGANVAAMVLVMIITTALVWFLWLAEPERRWLDITLNVLAVTVGLIGFGFATIGGFGNLYSDIRPDDPETEGSDSAAVEAPASETERNESRQRVRAAADDVGQAAVSPTADVGGGGRP